MPLRIEALGQPQIEILRLRVRQGHDPADRVLRIDGDEQQLLMRAEVGPLDFDHAVFVRHDVGHDDRTGGQKIEIGEIGSAAGGRRLRETRSPCAAGRGRRRAG